MDLTALGWQSLGRFGAVSYLFMDEERQNRIAGFFRKKLLSTPGFWQAGYGGTFMGFLTIVIVLGGNGLVMQRAMI